MSKPKGKKQPERLPEDEWVPLSSLLGSLNELKDTPIHPQQAQLFMDNEDGITTEFAGSIRRFLQSLIKHGPHHVVAMITRVAPHLNDPAVLSQHLHPPVFGESDYLVPPDPPLGPAWQAADEWFSGICKYGWTDDPRMRPKGSEKRYPHWLFQACLELAWEFLQENPDSPADAGAAARFLAEKGWIGWERAASLVPQERIEIRFPPMDFTRGLEEPRTLFVQRVLGRVASEVIVQVNLQATVPEWFRSAGRFPRPSKKEASKGRKPSQKAEAELVRRMLGDGTRTIGKPRGEYDNEPDHDVRERTQRVLVLLGFVSEDASDRAEGGDSTS